MAEMTDRPTEGDDYDEYNELLQHFNVGSHGTTLQFSGELATMKALKEVIERLERIEEKLG